MYRFRNIDEHSYPIESRVQTIIDGVNLDEKINGFMTLAVYGRELVGRNVEIDEFRKIQTASGIKNYATSYENRFVSSNIAPREFTVKFLLKANNDYDYVKKFGILNYYLDKEDVKIKFTDNLDYYYWGTVTKVENPQINNLQAICSFSIEVSNPFKFKVDAEKIEFEKTFKFKKKTIYPVKIENVNIKLKEAGQKLIFKNITDGREIIFDKNFNAGDVVNIDFTTWEITGKGNENFYKYLDIHSRLEEFTIADDDTIQTNLNADVVVTFREVRL